MEAVKFFELFNIIKELSKVTANYPGPELKKLGLNEVIPPVGPSADKNEWELMKEIHKDVLH